MEKTTGSLEWEATVTVWNWATWDSGGPDSGSTPYDIDTWLNYRISRGRNTRNFQAKVKSGAILPFTPWFQYEVQASRSGQIDATYTHDASSGFRNWTTGGPYIPAGTQGDLVYGAGNLKADFVNMNDADRFIQACWSKIYSTGWDGLTFVSELHKVVAMFRGFVKRLIANIARGRFDDIWLEWRYGWRTLLYDMQDIERAINSVDERRERFRESLGETETVSLENQGTAKLYEDDDNAYTHHSEVMIGVRGSVVADIVPPKIAINPIATGWELITLSFVIDWVFNVGRWIEALSGLALSSAHSSAGGAEIVRNFQGQSNWTPPPKYSGSCSSSTESREVLTVRTPRQVRKRPLFELDLDWLKVGDLLALLSQVLKRR